MESRPEVLQKHLIEQLALNTLYFSVLALITG